MTTSAKLKGTPVSGGNDLDKWRCVVVEDRISAMRPEELVAAIQDLGAGADPAILHPLLKAISKDAMTFLRRRVGTNHPNRGEDIVYRAHHSFITALFDPNSADWDGFRTAYYSRLSFRLKDAIAKELQDRRTEEDILASKAAKARKTVQMQEVAKLEQQHEGEEVDGDEDDFDEREASHGFPPKPGDGDDDDSGPTKAEYRPNLMDGVNDMLEQLDVDRLLEKCILDERKRLAFRLAMDDVPVKSIRTHSIANELGVDESTVRVWIDEVKEILKVKVGARHD